MFSRIIALLIRYKNISFGSLPRLISIFYWPSVQILFWGFFTNFLISNNSYSGLGVLNIILSAVILWDILFRGQLGLTMSFLEEIWSRNLTNLFISPIREFELAISLIFISFIRTVIGLTPAIFIANKVSPPPITTSQEDFARRWASLDDPLANRWSSIIPIGPFHKTISLL